MPSLREDYKLSRSHRMNLRRWLYGKKIVITGVVGMNMKEDVVICGYIYIYRYIYI